MQLIKFVLSGLFAWFFAYQSSRIFADAAHYESDTFAGYIFFGMAVACVVYAISSIKFKNY